MTETDLDRTSQSLEGITKFLRDEAEEGLSRWITVQMTSNTVDTGDGGRSDAKALAGERPSRFSRLMVQIKRPFFWLLGFNAPDYKDPRITIADLDPTEGQVRYAEMIAKQIEVEQGLSNSRMIWNLTFQGFTIAGYALVASSNGATPAKVTLETLIAVASGVIAYSTLRGVVASQVQRQYLKECWRENGLDRFFPQPFSISQTSSRGRLPSYSICLALIAMWATLLVAQFVYPGDDQPVTYVNIISSTEAVR